MSLRFAIAGGGWYGAHIASSLKSLGFNVVVFEKTNSLLTQASGNNQFRLHLGFHYARNYRTRLQSRDGYSRFIERYGAFTQKVEHNIYAIPAKHSLIDFMTYRLIMISSGIEFSEVNPQAYGLIGCSGALLTDERVILTHKARSYFKDYLSNSVKYNTPVYQVTDHGDFVKVNNEKFDYLIDCTWGKLTKLNCEVFYEPTLLLYYKLNSSNTPAITLVDGDLASLYPTEVPDIYSLSSVPHTPFGNFSDHYEAENFLKSVNPNLIEEKKLSMEQQIASFFPEFKTNFEYLEPQLSMKTKIIGDSDDRSCYVERKNNVFTVLSGKIDTVFYALERILASLEIEKTKNYYKFEVSA